MITSCTGSKTLKFVEFVSCTVIKVCECVCSSFRPHPYDTNSTDSKVLHPVHDLRTMHVWLTGLYEKKNDSTNCICICVSLFWKDLKKNLLKFCQNLVICLYKYPNQDQGKTSSRFLHYQDSVAFGTNLQYPGRQVMKKSTFLRVKSTHFNALKTIFLWENKRVDTC